MKQSGVREDDPEFIRCKQILAALSQQQNFQKAQKASQDAMARQRQQQSQHPGAQNHGIPNGANGVNGKRHETFLFHDNANAPT